MFKNKKALLSIIVLLAVSIIFAGCGKKETGETGQTGGGDTEKAIELKYAAVHSASSFLAEMDKQMFKRIEEQSNGKIKTELFFDGTLIKPTEWYQELIRGTADINHAQVGPAKDQFPLEYGLGFYLYGVTDIKDALEITAEVYNNFPEMQAEHKDIVPLSRITAGVAWIHTAKKPIRTLADFKGLNLKVADDQSTALIKALGANPVKLPITEAYTALDKGTIDGIITGVDGLKTYKLAEVTKYSTKLPYVTSWVYANAMNKDAWNKLSPDPQKIIKDNFAWWEEQLLVNLDRERDDSIKIAKERGNEIIELSPEVVDEMNKILETIAQEAAAGFDAKGLKGTEIYNFAREVVKTKVK